ncbi:MAG: Ada metal-binding domain-containing protein [Desulfobaccales bacterium]
MTKRQEPLGAPEGQDHDQERVIEAGKILLRDGSGKSRGKISANEDGSAGLILSDDAGTAWAWLGVNQHGEAFLELKDSRGEISFKVPAGAPSPEPPAASPVVPPSGATPNLAPASLGSLSPLQQPPMPEAETSAPVAGPEIGPSPPPASPDWKPGFVDTAVYDRLEELERQNRGRGFFRTVLLGLLAVVLATQAFLFFRTQTPQGSLEVQSLMVRDQNGYIRAWLGEKDGKLALNLRDQKGKLRAVMGLGVDGAPALILYDEKQQVRAELQLGPGGEPRFNLRDKSSLQGKTKQHAPGDPDNQQALAVSNPGDEDGTMASPAAGQEETVARDAAAETIFVGSKTSNKYHNPNCKWVRTIKRSNLIKFKSLEEAQGRHYIPCPVCKPPPLSK